MMKTVRDKASANNPQRDLNRTHGTRTHARSSPRTSTQGASMPQARPPANLVALQGMVADRSSAVVQAKRASGPGDEQTSHMGEATRAAVPGVMAFPRNADSSAFVQRNDSKDGPQIVLRLPMEGYGQPSKVLCWYSCYAMIYAYNGKSIAELDAALAKINVPKNRGLGSAEYSTVCRGLGLTGVHPYAVQAWSLEDWVHRIGLWGPLFVATTLLGGAGHAVVVYGADVRRKLIHYADPASYPDADAMTSTYAEFMNVIQPVGAAVQFL